MEAAARAHDWKEFGALVQYCAHCNGLRNVKTGRFLCAQGDWTVADPGCGPFLVWDKVGLRRILEAMEKRKRGDGDDDDDGAGSLARLR